MQNNIINIDASSMQIHNVKSLGKCMFPKILSSSTFIKHIQLNVIKTAFKLQLRTG